MSKTVSELEDKILEREAMLNAMDESDPDFKRVYKEWIELTAQLTLLMRDNDEK